VAGKCFPRAVLLSFVCFALLGCGGGKSDEEIKPVDYKANISHLKTYDRLGSATFVTNFVWWDSAGVSRQLRDYIGSPVVVTFWRTTVPASIRELHDVSVLAEKYRDSGLVFLGISLEEKGPRTEMFEHVASVIHSNGITMQQIIGSSELASAFGGIDLIPTVLLVTPNEKIGATLYGPRTPKDLEAQIRTLLPKR
jgi:thiol-disulfide isomerase/thioredoxin